MFKMEFKTGNDAFRDPFTGEESQTHKANETVKIINRISTEIAMGKTYGSIMDINGNSIGKWSLD